MITFLNLFTLLFWLVGVLVFLTAKGAPHEIEGLIFILTGFVACCGAALLDRLDKIKAAIEKQKTAPPASNND